MPVGWRSNIVSDPEILRGKLCKAANLEIPSSILSIASRSTGSRDVSHDDGSALPREIRIAFPARVPEEG
jgi:hypothetical protein